MQLKVNAHIKNMPEYTVPAPNTNTIPTNLIKLRNIENSHTIPHDVAFALNASMDKLHLYPQDSIHQLQDKLAAKLGVHSNNLVLGNGADEVLQLIALAFLDSNKVALVSEHSFAQYDFVTSLVGASVKKVPLYNYHVNPKMFLEYLTTETSVIFLCNPHNPTGTYFNELALIDFMGKVPKDVLVVIDEVFYEFALAEDFPDTINLLNKYPNLVIVRTFSKIWSLAGLRLGYAISSSQVVKYLNNAKQPYNINVVAVEAASLMLSKENWITDILGEIESQKNYIYESLDTLQLKYLKSATNFVFIYFPFSSHAIVTELLNKGIAVRNLASFGFDSAIRVKIGLPQENKVFIENLTLVMQSQLKS
jgi:histidinol-phosphate aminotransferase